MNRMILSRLKVFVQIAIIFSVLSISSYVESKKSSSSHKQQEPTIEEVTAKQLERILADKDYVAVYWCKSKMCENLKIWRICENFPRQLKSSWNCIVWWKKSLIFSFHLTHIHDLRNFEIFLGFVKIRKFKREEKYRVDATCYEGKWKIKSSWVSSFFEYTQQSRWEHWSFLFSRFAFQKARNLIALNCGKFRKILFWTNSHSHGESFVNILCQRVS